MGLPVVNTVDMTEHEKEELGRGWVSKQLADQQQMWG